MMVFLKGILFQTWQDFGLSIWVPKMASVSSNQRTPCCVDSAPVHPGSGISGIHVAVGMMGAPCAIHYREYIIIPFTKHISNI